MLARNIASAFGNALLRGVVRSEASLAARRGSEASRPSMFQYTIPELQMLCHDGLHTSERSCRASKLTWLQACGRESDATTWRFGLSSSASRRRARVLTQDSYNYREPCSSTTITKNSVRYQAMHICKQLARPAASSPKPQAQPQAQG